MKILLAFDSFKDCLSSEEICHIVSSVLSEKYDVYSMPLSDGGEGCCYILTKHLGGNIVPIEVSGPLGNKINAEYGIVGRTAYIESASACGLQLVPKTLRNPLITTSYGVGEMICDAAERGCNEVVLGLGGSSTNDAGIGLLQALGINFYDEMGKKVGFGGKCLSRIKSFDNCQYIIPFTITALCDVRNVFYGKDGAAQVFSPQKGASESMVTELDDGLKKLNELIISKKGINLQYVQGSGCAGGIAGGLYAFAGAKLCRGTEFIFDKLNFEQAVEQADLIITGEGKSDVQTLMGKLPFEVAKVAKNKNKRVVLMSGKIEDTEKLYDFFDYIYPITPTNQSISEAIRPSVAKKNITRVVNQINFEKI